MTIKLCNNCGKYFSTRVIKLDNFCSMECKTEFTNKQKDKNKLSNAQAKMEFNAKQKEREADFRLSRRRI